MGTPEVFIGGLIRHRLPRTWVVMEADEKQPQKLVSWTLQNSRDMDLAETWALDKEVWDRSEALALAFQVSNGHPR